MHTRETCLQKYIECKANKNGAVPEYREFLNFSDIDKRSLSKLFGAAPYSKPQEEAGDAPNRLQTERTPVEQMMRQYGEVDAVPTSPEWDHRGLKPSESGLRARPHNMKWSELPSRFMEWVDTNRVPGFERAIEIITKSRRATNKLNNDDRSLSRLISDIHVWTPARRRNSEAEYKIELRKHLESIGYSLNEEYGESLYDLLAQKKYAVEIKKDPNLSEYDQLFGQVTRHLQHQRKVIVLILEATRGDNYDHFALLVDSFLNVGENSVDVLKK